MNLGWLKKRFILSFCVFAILITSAAGITVWRLYETAFAQASQELIAIAKSQRYLMEAVSRFDSINSREDHPLGAFGATMSQIMDASKHYSGDFGRTGELVMASTEDNQMIFIRQRHGDIDTLTLTTPPAEPMKRALNGESGTIVALDYRNETVLAAYEPLHLETKNFGIVAKIDLSEIRQPFIKTGVLGIIISAGIILLTGLIFSHTVEQQPETGKSQHTPIPAWKIPAVIATVIIGAVITAITSYLYCQLQLEQEQKAFIRAADNQVAALQQQIEINMAALSALSGFMEHSQDVSRDEFRIFVEHLLKNNISLRALSWNPKVDHHKRANFEKRALTDGFNNFQFIERQDGKLVPADKRDEYTIVYYIEPIKNNELALGYDISSEEVRRTTLERARDSGMPVSTSPIQLVQDKIDGFFSFLVIEPVYEGPFANLKQRRENILGYSVAVLDVHKIVAKALSQVNTGSINVDLHIFDSSDSQQHLIYPSQEELFSKNHFKNEENFHLTKDIAVAGRVWTIKALHTKTSWRSGHLTWEVLQIFFGCSALIFLISLLIRNAANKTAEIKVLVKEKTAELSHSEAKAKAIVDTAINAIITINEKGIVKSFNPAAEKMFAYSKNEVIGKNVNMLMPKSDKILHDKYLRNYIDSGEEKIIGTGREAVGQRKDNSTFPIHLSVGEAILGTERLFVGYLIDITKQKKHEEELSQHRDNLEQLVQERTSELEEAKIEAETATEAKTAFLANTSHEIRTPMNAVMGFLQLALEQKPLDRDTKHYIDIAYNSANSLLTIINDVLDVSKLESNKLILESICFHLPNTIKSAIRTLECGAKEKGLPINFDYTSSLPECYLGDPTRLRQIILNLLGNAIKFTDKGSVTIKIETDSDQENALHFSITDTGIGIPADRIDRIFDSFSQVDSSTTRRFGGTGLGTTISKQLVHLMGGNIWAESKLNHGSTFHFTVLLPETSCNEACDFITNTNVFPELRSPRQFNILFADDIEQNSILGRVRLEEQGHTVSFVDNGLQAVNEFRSKDFDIILMDVQMPIMDGLEATREIRKIEAGTDQHIPIIATTAAVMKEDIEQCIEAGIDAVVAKPINFSELFLRMETLVPRDRGQSQTETHPQTGTQIPDSDFSPITSVVDIKQAKEIWGDMDIYRDVITSFVPVHGADADKIRTAIRAGELEKAQSLTHALKGVAANIALVDISARASDLHQKLKDGIIDCDEQINQLAKELARATVAITNYAKHSDT